MLSRGIQAHYLLQHQANIHLTDKKRATPLHYAVGDKELVEELLQRGAAIEVPTQEGATPLMYASSEVNPATVQVLLEAGAKADRLDRSGKTPLHYLCLGGDLDVVEDASYKPSVTIARMLIEHGAELNRKDKTGKTPLQYAKERGRDTLVQFLTQAGAESKEP